jgi:hypothetical protein
MHISVLSIAFAAIGAWAAEQWIPEGLESGGGIVALVLALALVPSAFRKMGLLVAMVVVFTLLPVLLVLTAALNWDESTLISSYAQMIWIMGISGGSWGCAMRGGRWSLAGSLVLISLIVAPTTRLQDQTNSEGSLIELEAAMVRGNNDLLQRWIELALNQNVGPQRLRHFCKQSRHDFSGGTSNLDTRTQTVCRALLHKFPERGGRELLGAESSKQVRLAVDLFAEAGLWDEASMATHRAVKLGAAHSALNLWRWKRVKGRQAKGVEDWAGWNSETTFEGPAGAERSAVRVTGASGGLKPMILSTGKRAIMAVNRYGESFTVDLPKPPSKKVQSFSLMGQARNGFGFEILDAGNRWHRYRCDKPSKPTGVYGSSFCNERLGTAVVELDESIRQPLRRIRVRGNFILQGIQASARQ